MVIIYGGRIPLVVLGTILHSAGDYIDVIRNNLGPPNSFWTLQNSCCTPNATGSAPPLIKTFKYFWLCTGDNNKIELLCKQMNTLILLYKQTKVIFTEFSLYLVKHWVFSSPTSHYITNLSRSNGWKLIGQTRPTAGLLPPYCRPSKKRG